MKTSSKLIALILVVISSSAFAALPKEQSVKLIESKHKNLFVFKVEKALKGAEVEVYSASGNLITKQKLSTRKMIIDFKEVKFGAYTVQIKKDGAVQEFNYEKKLVISDVIR